MEYRARKASAYLGEPVQETDADWHSGTDIVAMLKAADVEVAQRSGSRVLLKKGAERMVVHRPHPEPETGRATVRDIAVFLDAVGVKP